MSPFSLLRCVPVVALLLLNLTCQALTPAQVAADVALAREAFERVHPGYDRYTSASVLGGAWQAIADDAQADGGMSQAALYLRVQGVLAQIRCEHTKAELPSAMAKARRTDPVYLPLRFELVEDRAIVVAVAPGTEVQVHEELISIDGVSMTTLIDRYEPLIPVDGFTDEVKHVELAWSLEFSGGAIEHFMALDGVPPIATLQVRDATGAQRTIKATRIGLDAQRQLRQGRAANFVDAVAVEYLDEKTARLNIDTFVNYRKRVDPDDIYAPLFKTLNQRGIQHLIVDLRRNGGGSDDARDRLLAHLILERTTMHAEEWIKTLNLDGLRDHLSTWDSRALHPKRWWFAREAPDKYRMRSWWIGGSGRVKPARHAYKGRLTLLSSAGNGSGTTMLMTALQKTGRARVVGEPTGGNVAGPTAGVLFTLTLPESGVRLRLPIIRSVSGYDEADSGRGIVPEVLIPKTVEALRAGRDPALEKALATP